MTDQDQSRIDQFTATQQAENQLMIDYLDQVNTEEFEITEQELFNDQGWITASRVLHEANTGNQFEGTDEDAARYGLEEMGKINYSWFNVDMPWTEEDSKGLVGYMMDIENKFTDRQKLALMLLYDTYEAKDGFFGSGAGWWRATKNMAQDPSNYFGVGALASLGLKFLGRETAKSGFKLFLENSANSILSKTGVTLAVTEGAAYGASDSIMRQEFEADLQDEHFPISEYLNSETVTGTIAGALLPGTMVGAPTAVKTAITKWNDRTGPLPKVPEDRPDLVIVEEPIKGKRPLTMTETILEDVGDATLTEKRVVVDESKVDVDAENFNFPELPKTIPDDDPRVSIDTQTKHKKSVGEQTEFFNPTFGHQGVPQYKAARKKIHDRIIFNTVNVKGSRAAEGEKPVVVFMGGGGGSGKSTVLDSGVESGLIPDLKYVTINPDDVKADLPDYKKVRRAGDYRAAEIVHEESSDVADMALAQAVQENRNIVIDKTMANPGKNLALMELLRQKGYEIRFVGVTVDPGTAVNRNLGRFYNSGRLPQLQAMVRSHKAFNGNAEQYLEAADIGVIVDTSGNSPVTFVSKNADGSVEVTDPDLLDIMLGRGQIDENAQTIRQLREGGAERRADNPEGRMGESTGTDSPKGEEGQGTTGSLADERLGDEVGPKVIGEDSVGRPLLDFRGAEMFHFTDSEAAGSITKDGYQIVGDGYYGDAVSFTHRAEYGEQFAGSKAEGKKTVAKISEKANILNSSSGEEGNIVASVLNDPTLAPVKASAKPGQKTWRDKFLELGIDGVYDPGAGDLFMFNTDMISTLRVERVGDGS